MFGQVAWAGSSPCKTFLFVFLKVMQNFEIENFAPPKAQGSRMPLVRAVYHDLLRRVAARSNQGRNDGVKGHNSPGAESLWGRRKVLTILQELQCSTFASVRPQVRTYGRQTCLLPRMPSNPVTPLKLAPFFLRDTISFSNAQTDVPSPTVGSHRL